MSPTLSIFFTTSKEKDGLTVTMESRRDSIPIVSDKGQQFARSLFPSVIETNIRLVTNGAESIHRGLYSRIGARVERAVIARSGEAASLLRDAANAVVHDGDGKGLFGDACSQALDLVEDIVSIRKLLRGYVLGPKRAKNSVLMYLPDQVN